MKLTICSIAFALAAMTSMAHAAGLVGKNFSCTPVHKQLSNGGDSVATLDLYGDDQGNFSVDGGEGSPNLSKDPNAIELNGFNSECNGAKVKINLTTGEGSKEVQYQEHTILFGERCTSDSATSFTGCKAAD